MKLSRAGGVGTKLNLHGRRQLIVELTGAIAACVIEAKVS